MLFSPGFEEGGGGALTVHPYWVLVSIVQFLLVFYLLRRFLWGPVLRTLRDRAARIREALELAQVRSAVAGMVGLAAGGVLGREVNPEQHRELIERSIEEAGAQLSEGQA